jgi:hypothetical protein
MTEINHRKMEIRGRFERLGKPHGYADAASTIVKADVNFRIEGTLKNVKSR